MLEFNKQMGPLIPISFARGKKVFHEPMWSSGISQPFLVATRVNRLVVEVKKKQKKKKAVYTKSNENCSCFKN